jgi:hypothetical protein
VEKKIRNKQVVPPQVSARLFSVARSDSGDSKNSPGIVIQIRMKAASTGPVNKLLTRKNTEFWLSAND